MTVRLRSLAGLRWICVACGVEALVALGLIKEGDQSNYLAQFALVALGLATAIGWWQLAPSGGISPMAYRCAKDPRSHAWLLVTVAVALTTAVAVQSWFEPGTSIATGDIAPPDGTAWLSRLFEPWAWTGSNLGEPSQLPLSAPWAAVLSTVTAFGGDPALAQRIWYSALFVGGGLGALAFMAAIRLGPIASLVGATAYVLNPYVVVQVNTYANYMAALGLLASLPAVLIAVGSGRLKVQWGAALLTLSAPLLGYAFLNPPLVGLIVGAILITPLFVAWADGIAAASRSALCLALAAPLMLAASAYWIIAASVQISSAGQSQLTSLSSWTWTEGRATIRNAFWLNSIWSWSFPEYFPYAQSYDAFPLSAAKFVLPAAAFAALGLGRLPTHSNDRHLRDRLLRIAIAAATVALIVILLSTGTNPPGNVVFNRLYDLPFGWLLREPGRFLMAGALAYAVLIAVAVEGLVINRSVAQFLRAPRPSANALRLLYVPVALGALLLVGFPLYTGNVVPDHRPTLPSAHVRVPSYWSEMAHVVDGLPEQGGLMVMPPDDFYQMPYVWGYYGSDGFVVDFFKRPVLLPNTQEYTPTSIQVTAAVTLTAQSILRSDWSQAAALLNALNTPMILVRRDIASPYPGRSILPPNDLAEALGRAPNFVLLRQIGSLDLFEIKSALSDPETTSNFVTMESQVPDLRLLSLLPGGTAIIDSHALPGVTSIDQSPPFELWQHIGDALVWHPLSPTGSKYRIADLDSQSVVSLDRPGAFGIGSSGARIVYSPTEVGNAITVSVSQRADRDTLSLFLLATPISQPSLLPRLVVLHNSYSTRWTATSGRHVEVDGMLNGWLVSGSPVFNIAYAPATDIATGRWISLGALVAASLLVASVWKWPAPLQLAFNATGQNKGDG